MKLFWVIVAALVAAGIPQQTREYRPTLAVPESMQPFLKQLEPGHDAFVLEGHVKELEGRLGELSDALRGGPSRIAAIARTLLDPSFRGGRLQEATGMAADAPLVVKRDANPSRVTAIDAAGFGVELQRLVADMREVRVAEFQITSIAHEGAADLPLHVRTIVRYDLVGSGTTFYRAEHVGQWEMSWRKNGAAWQIVEWIAVSHTASRARMPLFTEITNQALGANESFRRQLGIDLDSWMATFDSVLTRDSNGHHGVSAGDADGDGLDDLYVAQPAGLPNRLYRNRGDSTFEDITDAAGVGVLDDTAESLFADVDNDGDEDLVLSTATQPLLFLNDGKGHFTAVPDAFRFAQPLQGVLTSISMADYDRDGYLDLYLCVYSYFFGAGEDKAGTPAPYYDARNGPPGVLFHNDGHGRFVDATKDAGLDAGNDRYHFAAAWGDYDGDGWPDLLVANDFGTKNLYHNVGARGGSVKFEDVATAAGVLDHGAGMSATFLDYDNDGNLDIYTGNMWSAPGQRVTAAPAFMRDATPEMRALYRRHVRGNTLLRNLGNGRFEDKTIDAHAEMGRWAWSSDAVDFDSDGFDDLYIVNGMLTRAPAAAPREAGGEDLEGFFWRQVVAHSPLTRVPGTAYDEAWRAINQFLMHGSIASHQRNVFLRNDGHGGFDEVSGTLGLDLDQDGRSFAVMDIDRDGDADLVVMAARQAPQLRVFRNDVVDDRTKAASLDVRLTGTTSNHDAVGARVTVETDRLTRTKVVQAGSGFLSEHSKELTIGLGASDRVVKLTVNWPSGQTQTFATIPLNSRISIVEGGDPRIEPFARHPSGTSTTTTGTSSSAPTATWLYEPFPAPDFSVTERSGGNRSLAALKGKPAVVLLWSAGDPASRAVFDTITRDAAMLTKGGVGSIALDVDDPANQQVALSYAILNRHLFMNRQDLRLPTCFLLDPAGNIVKAYRDRIETAQIIKDALAADATPPERLKRALPFDGTFYSGLPLRNFLPYGRELLDQGLEAAAIVAFERAAQANPGASTLYRLGTLLARSGEPARARAAYERAIALKPDLAEAHNDLGTLLAQEGDLEGAVGRFRAALAAMPDYPDALNNLGYALLLTGHDQEAKALYEKALALQPDFPEALNNLGLLLGRGGDMNGAEGYFRDALKRRPDYGEAANNLALVLVAKGESDAAVRLLTGLLERTPDYEAAYVTLAKIHLTAGRTAEGIGVLERLLQRNPKHPLALELLRQYKRD